MGNYDLNNVAKKAVKDIGKNFLSNDIERCQSKCGDLNACRNRKSKWINICVYLETETVNMLDYQKKSNSILDEIMPWSKVMQFMLFILNTI